MRVPDLPFAEVWALDFEFSAPPGERPLPLCLVAREVRTDRELRLWADELRALAESPFPEGSLLIAYYASAEIGCFLGLGWKAQYQVLDLFTEFRCLTNGKETPCGNGLLGALMYFGLPAMNVTEKDEMRNLALRGGAYTEQEKLALLDYCAEDVFALVRLLPCILASMTDGDLQRALMRGAYMAAAAEMEHNGVPIDGETFRELRENWDGLRHDLIAELDANYNVFVNGSFNATRWAAWLSERRIPWPFTERGHLKLDDETFKDMGRMYPEVETMRQLRHALSQLRLNDLALGHDDRNRCILSAFRSSTGRNQPSTSKFIFGPSAWLRFIIRAMPGYGLAYVDWEQQEFGIAAYLSGDANMISAYESDDPYIAFARLAAAVPAGATKQSHPIEREKYKTCALAVQYGMGPDSLGQKLGITSIEATDLLRKHHEAFRTYWHWSDGVLNHALLLKRLYTVFGWNLRVEGDANQRSLRNFPMQANGAEMMRLAAVMAIDDGLELVAPVHDAFLLHAPLTHLEEHVARLQWRMAESSALVLNGPRLKTEAKVFRYPERFSDRRGEQMWTVVDRLLSSRRT